MIRKATADDLPEIVSIIGVVREGMSKGGNPQWNSGYPGEKEYREDIFRGDLYLDVREEGLAGFVTLNRMFPDEYAGVQWTTGIPAGTMHRLAVNPAFRKRGIARDLFDFAERYFIFRCMKSIRIDTFSLNRAAQELFKSSGYRFAGEIFMKGKSLPYFCYEKPLAGTNVSSGECIL